MNETTDVIPDQPVLIVPANIECIIAGFDDRTEAFSSMDVYSALCAARRDMEMPTLSEYTGAWAEILALGLAGTEHNEKPWGTYFGPMGSMAAENGDITYFPDARKADATILAHWRSRARACKAPVLVARYNDLVWDLSKLIADEKRDIAFARRAIDAYVAGAMQEGRDAHDAFPDAERALVLTIQIDDKPRRDAARAALLALHKVEVARKGMWWKAYDALEGQAKAGLTDEERDGLIEDLEAVVERSADTSDPDTFNPHELETAANKLIAHYRRSNQNAEVPRLHLSVAKAFEHFGGLADAMLASIVFQTSMDAYRQAGMHADAERILRLIEKSNVAAVAQMTMHEHQQEIPAEVIEKFLAQIVTDTKEGTFHRMAGEFMTSRAGLEKALQESAKSSPLAAVIPRSKLKGDRVVAQIGSLSDDPTGHLIDQANGHLAFNTSWLHWALDRAKERHALTGDDITDWANRTKLFGDGRLLREGVAAWMIEDHIKAAHILVPQIEAGFRTLIGRCGRPTTKAHQVMKQARVVVTMGDMLSQEETAVALGASGPDIMLHFRALYADPRGHNLRNDIAHGLLAVESINSGVMLWVIHSLLLLGGWLKLESEPSGEDAPSSPSSMPPSNVNG
jgi:lysyl-tRNA synthetase class 1